MGRVGLLNLDKNSRSEVIIFRSVNGVSLPSAEGRGQSKRFLSDPMYDAIAVIGSDLKKAEYIKEALLSGKHVLTDFPASHKLDEVQQLHDIAAEKQLCLSSPNLMKTELGLPELKQTAITGTSRLLSLTITHGLPALQGVRRFSMKLAQLLDLTEWLTNSKYVEAFGHETMAGRSSKACIVLLSMENGIKALVNLYSISGTNKERLWVDGIFEDSIVRVNPYVQSLRVSHPDNKPDEDIEWGQSPLDFALQDFFTQISEKKIMDIEHTKRLLELTERVLEDA